ncbi:MAG TPA: hypothetical protein VFL99_03175 [Segeticoccus sp.]|uniref:hypothetical protein n=1 Tax=Segeticoccus sp. TaxID=2706531 RepID=UPI002D80C377|nr:hypothetical protein [Segeticoccus sp.]HET8599302.1 hypothetical protein [Segeticoccus sp.]
MRKSLALAALPAALLLPATAGLAHAAPDPSAPSGVYSVDLAPVPDNPAAVGGSHVHGHATIWVHGRNLTVRLRVRGVTPGEPHAMHIHGMLGMNNTCPTLKDDVNTGDPLDPASFVPGVPDGIISLSEGHTAYGPVQVSLTKTGSTGPGAALNVPQFTSANDRGVLTYRRSFKVPITVAKDLTQLHVVVHGLHLPQYPGSSSLGNLFEATTPVACGRIVRR